MSTGGFRSVEACQKRCARTIHEQRCKVFETEARRGCSQLRVTQAYPPWYVEEAERERPRRAKGQRNTRGVYLPAQ